MAIEHVGGIPRGDAPSKPSRIVRPVIPCAAIFAALAVSAGCGIWSSMPTHAPYQALASGELAHAVRTEIIEGKNCHSSLRWTFDRPVTEVSSDSLAILRGAFLYCKKKWNETAELHVYEQAGASAFQIARQLAAGGIAKVYAPAGMEVQPGLQLIDHVQDDPESMENVYFSNNQPHWLYDIPRDRFAPLMGGAHG